MGTFSEMLSRGQEVSSPPNRYIAQGRLLREPRYTVPIDTIDPYNPRIQEQLNNQTITRPQQVFFGADESVGVVSVYTVRTVNMGSRLVMYAVHLKRLGYEGELEVWHTQDTKSAIMAHPDKIVQEIYAFQTKHNLTGNLLGGPRRPYVAVPAGNEQEHPDHTVMLIEARTPVFGWSYRPDTGKTVGFYPRPALKDFDPLPLKQQQEELARLAAISSAYTHVTS